MRVGTDTARRSRHSVAAAGVALLLGAGQQGVQAADGLDLTVPLANMPAQPIMAAKVGTPGDADAVTNYFAS